MSGCRLIQAIRCFTKRVRQIVGVNQHGCQRQLVDAAICYVKGFTMSGVGGTGGARNGNSWENYGSITDRSSEIPAQPSASGYGAPQARPIITPQSLTRAPAAKYTVGGNASKIAKREGATRSQVNTAGIVANTNILRDAGATNAEIAEFRMNKSKTMEFVKRKEFAFSKNEYGYKNERNKDGFFVRDMHGYPDAPHEREHTK